MISSLNITRLKSINLQKAPAHTQLTVRVGQHLPEELSSFPVNR